MRLFARRGTTILLACIAVSVFVTACASGADTEQNWLFFQTADGGAYDEGMLTLEGVDYTVAFTERPERQVANVTNDELGRAWHERNDSFADDPPNAALAYDSADITGRAVVELTSITVKDDRVVYSVDVLEGQVPEGPFDRVTLVIDPLGAIFPSDQN